ncbi:LytR C-terminal domain-containing protein [Demequina sp. NBRC 110056]|uniref:LytR C-terminal domain-containing protein n=1 Tax=Demequina sp. NBRC 110056 TaxID=1570345 RepID=UPI0009FCCF40|nr:LytR C-terminal domain-containing protein [Demequina sp. NBRC 110056]
MSQSQTGPDPKRRKAVRRHRRERQIVVFGVIIIAIAAVVFMASAIYNGDVEGPFASEFKSPAADLDEVDLVCPPVGEEASLPLDPSAVVVRVDNSTDVPGLAGTTADTLEGRGFVVVGTTNWPRSYDGNVEIYFGSAGVQHAYTLARQFTDARLVLDNRPDITLDLVLGEEFGESPQLREPLAPELSPTLPLTADGECRPANLVVAVPAPRTLPENPLATASPSPSPSPEG